MKSQAQQIRDRLQKELYRGVGGRLTTNSVEQLVSIIDNLVTLTIEETAKESVSEINKKIEQEKQNSYNQGLNVGYQSALKYMSKEKK